MEFMFDKKKVQKLETESKQRQLFPCPCRQFQEQSALWCQNNQSSSAVFPQTGPWHVLSDLKSIIHKMIIGRTQEVRIKTEKRMTNK